MIDDPSSPVRPRIAWLRPHETLSDYEMAYVLPLEDEFDLRVITTGRPAIGSSFRQALRLRWPDEFTWRGRPRSLFNGLYARVFNRRYHIPGLARHLGDVQIVQGSEAASECSFQAARLREKVGFKLLLSASENQPILAPRSPAEIDRIRYTLSRVDHAFAIPLEAKERLMEAGLPESRISVIGHGIDCSRFRPATQRPVGPFRVGFCGRFRREKGLHHLVAAMRSIDADLHLLGDGPDHERLRAMASPRTIFHPALPYHRIHEFYQGIDLFVLPSIPVDGLVEQFGFVLMEAMASGVPIVASRIGGIPGVAGEAALLVPPGDERALAEAIAALMQDESRRRSMIEAGLRVADARFRMELVTDRMREVFRQLLR